MSGLIGKLLLTLRVNGLAGTLRIARYSILRTRLDRRYPHKLPRGVLPSQPGWLRKFRACPRVGAFSFDSAELEVAFLAADLVRVSWSPGSPPPPYALEKTDWPSVPLTYHEIPDGYVLDSGEVGLTVFADGRLRFCTRGGTVLRQEQAPFRQAETWIHPASIRPDERLFGLGEQPAGLDLRGRKYRMWNTDPGGSYGPQDGPLYMPLPVYLGLHGAGSYLIFYENPYPAEFDFTRNPRELIQTSRATFEGGMLRYYFIPGPPERALERFTELTGRPPLPPRWSLGYHQCRWGYKTEADVRRVAEGFAANDMPLSAIHLDIDYMDGYRVFSVDRARFLSLSGLSQKLAGQGVRLVTIVDPGIKQDRAYDIYQQAVKGNYLIRLPNGKPLAGLVWPGWSVFPDFTNPETRRWWGDQYTRLLQEGIAGFWHDMNEPTSFSSGSDMTLPLAARHDLEGAGADHHQAHNLYALLMNRAGYEGLRRLQPERRPWIFSRSGWAGQARYAWNWTGDTESTWAGLRMTVPTVLNLSLAGQPFSGPDIGGFSGNPSAELYLRSFQMAAFLPFFRTHSSTGTAPREPWTFGEPYTSILRDFLKLRYRLMPYLYTLAWEAAQNGHPLVRPLFWGSGKDPDLWDIEDEFLLGDSLLVAPVVEEGAASRQVMLPSGGWYSFWDDVLLRGPGAFTLPAPLEQIPLLVRAGSILPLEEAGILTLHAYAPVMDGPGTVLNLYSDAGDGSAGGGWRLDRFTVRREGRSLHLSWQNEEHAFAFPYARVAIHPHGLPGCRVWVQGSELPNDGESFLLFPPEN